MRYRLFTTICLSNTRCKLLTKINEKGANHRCPHRGAIGQAGSVKQSRKMAIALRHENLSLDPPLDFTSRRRPLKKRPNRTENDCS